MLQICFAVDMSGIKKGLKCRCFDTIKAMGDFFLVKIGDFGY